MTLRRSPIHWLRAMRRWLAVGVFVSLAPFASADTDYSGAWGPAIGSTVPLMAAPDQTGSQQTFDTLKGTNGLLFVFNRSVDW